MQRRAIEVGKISIGFIEEQREIGSRQNDGVDSIAFEERVSKRRQVPVLLFSAFSRSSQLDIRVVDVVRLVWPRLDDFDLIHLAEERRFHDEAGAKNGHPSNRSDRKFLDERLEDIDNRQRRGGDEFP